MRPPRIDGEFAAAKQRVISGELTGPGHNERVRLSQLGAGADVVVIVGGVLLRSP